MRILVVGAGAVGGYFGGRLAAAGRDVTFLVRAARAAQLQRDGLRIVSSFGDATVAAKTISAQEIDGPYDVILLSVKAYSLEPAMNDFAPAVGPETMILPLLNGMRHLDVLAARFGEQSVLGGVSHISADLDSDGRILHLGPLQDLVFGARNREVTPRIQSLGVALCNAGFEEKLSPDIIASMWQKWVVLAALASITCLLRGSIGEAAALPRGLETERTIVSECAAIASAAGYPPPQTYLDTVGARLTEQGSPLTASMYRDLHKGAPVEVEQTLGDLLTRGSALGINTPLVKAAYVQLAIYQSRLNKA
jgi:2-dehydropantoate 2-reductase